jgi:hypothetical protein
MDANQSKFLAMLNGKSYHPPDTRILLNGEDLKTGISKNNPFAPDPKFLKFGSVKNRTEVLLSDKKTKIFVAPGHDIEKAIARYGKSLLFKKFADSRHDGVKLMENL